MLKAIAFAIVAILQVGCGQAGADRLVSEWRQDVAHVREEQAKLPPAASFGEDLKRRIELEQAARRGIAMIERSGLSPEERRDARAQIRADIEAIDRANLEAVLAARPNGGWFTIGEYGEETAHNAWLVVQHASDVALQEQVLKLMEPLVAARQVSPADYALLYDRVQVAQGRSQRYGSQATCRNGKIDFLDIEDRERVDARRREMDLMPIAEYGRGMGIGLSC